MLFLDYQDRRPIYEQIVEKFRLLILSGAMEPDSRMPSVRQLAMELSINPNTIQRSYRALESDGWIVTVPGKGCFVSTNGNCQEQERLRLLDQLAETCTALTALGMTREEICQQIRKGEMNHA